MPKLNQLTRETKAMWSGIDRVAKNGDDKRADNRAYDWFVWRDGLAERQTYSNDRLHRREDGQWCLGYFESTRERGFRETVFRETSAPFALPPHCQPVKYADRWHDAHQIGADEETCYRVAMGWDTLDRITAPEQMELAA